MIADSPRQRNKPSTSKVVKNQENQLLMKYGHAYFPLRSIQKSKVSSRLNALLHSYPCWFIKESLLHTDQFHQISRKIVSVDVKELYLFEEKQSYQHIPPKFKILSQIDGISFTNLKVLHIMLMRDNNFEELSWLNAPVLEQLYVSTQGSFTSIKPLQKGQFKNLYLVNFRVSGEDHKREARMFDLKDFHRTRMLSRQTSSQLLPKPKLYTPPGTMSVFRRDLSNISILAKLQIERLTNFHIPHLQLSKNQHHRFTPNVQFPWCPQLQFCQCRLYRVLNRRFENKTIALSIIDFVLDQDQEYERRYVRRNRMLDEGSDMGEDEDNEGEGIDSDLD